MRPRWEYMALHSDNAPSVEQLTAYGVEGWELVSILFDVKGEPSRRAAGGYLIYLKRPATGILI